MRETERSPRMANGPAQQGPEAYRRLARMLPVTERVQGVLLHRARSGVIRLLRQAVARRVLDVGCGSGCLTCRLMRAGYEAHGVDASPAMAERAARKRRTASIWLGDAEKMPYTREFDAAVISLVLHELDPAKRERVWARMRDSVRRGGLLIALDYCAPAATTWKGAAWRRLIEKDEQGMGRLESSHYANFRQFMGAGGLAGWIAARGERDSEHQMFLGGNLGLFAVAA